MIKENDLEIPKEFKGDLFHWIVTQRLVNYPIMPIEGVFPLKEYGYKDVQFENELEYIALIRQIEKQFPEFKYQEVILNYLDLDRVNHPYEIKFIPK